MAEAPDHGTSLAPSAQNEAPPFVEKLELIKRFMTVVGIQSRLDSGSFLKKYTLVAELDWHEGEVEISEAVTGPVEALKAEYEKYRSI